MKKLSLVVGLVLSLSVGSLYCFNFTLPYTDNSQSVLQAGTTAAFTIYGSAYSVDTDSCTFKVFESSISVVISSNGITNAEKTYTFNLLLSTSDTHFDLINRFNDTGYLTATIVNGCYGLQMATGSASIRVDSEGTTDGLAYDATGKNYGNILGSTNTKTIFDNNTLNLSRYFAERNGVYNVVQTAVSLAQGTTMYLYEGITSTCTTTEKAIGISDVNEKNYSDYAPVKTTRNYALEYRVMFSTWVNTAVDKMQIFYFKQ